MDLKSDSLKNFKLDDKMSSSEQIYDFTNKNYKRKDITQIEVFPTNVDIPSGTVDSPEELSILFNWSEEEYNKAKTQEKWTNIEYKDNILSNDVLEMTLKTHSLKKDCDIIIDFGDDSEKLVVRTAEIGINSHQPVLL